MLEGTAGGCGLGAHTCTHVPMCVGGGQGKQTTVEKGTEVNIFNFLVATLKSKNKQVKLTLYYLLFNPTEPEYC